MIGRGDPTYKTPTAFRHALEARLLAEHRNTGVSLDRLRKLVAFERFLARMVASEAPFWAIKGGYALELRISKARSTTDLDLTVQVDKIDPRQAYSQIEIAELLQAAAVIELPDYFVYRVGAAQNDLDAAPYGGTRFPVIASVAGRMFERIQVDVAVNEPTLGVDKIDASNRLVFAGIPSVTVPTIVQEVHFAEKLHAYTLPRSTPNSRVKDFVDLVLFLERGLVRPPELGEAIRHVFESRNTHSIPSAFPSPPTDWTERFSTMATECGIAGDMTSAHERVSIYLAPILNAIGI